MALVAVLWLITLLTVIAGSHVRNTRGETRLVARHVEQASARAAVNAAAQLAVMQLLASEPPVDLRVDGTVTDWSYAGLPVRIAIRNATGMIDINRAGPEVMQSLLVEIGVDRARQDEIIGALFDKHADFISVEEMRYLAGMSPGLFTDIAPFLTVWSGQSSVNLQFAPPLLLRALTGRDIEQAPGGAAAVQRRGNFHIYVDVPGEYGAMAAAEIVVRIGGSAGDAWSVLEWREGMRKPFPDDRSRWMQ